MTTAKITGFDKAAAITPNDNANLGAPTKAIWVGGAGNITVDMASLGTVTFNAVPVGTMLLVQAKKVYATGTTATLLIGLWGN